MIVGERRIIGMHIRSIGIDLGKTTFHLVGLGERGKVILKKKPLFEMAHPRSRGWRVLGGAMLSEVSILSGWVSRRPGRLMSIYCLIGMFSLPLGQVLLRPAGSSVSEVPRMVWVLAPFMAPAMMCLVPYYVGVGSLHQAARTAIGRGGRP